MPTSTPADPTRRPSAVRVLLEVLGVLLLVSGSCGLVVLAFLYDPMVGGMVGCFAAILAGAILVMPPDAESGA